MGETGNKHDKWAKYRGEGRKSVLRKKEPAEQGKGLGEGVGSRYEQYQERKGGQN